MRIKSRLSERESWPSWGRDSDRSGFKLQPAKSNDIRPWWLIHPKNYGRNVSSVMNEEAGEEFRTD